jgi:hypothetical protein
MCFDVPKFDDEEDRKRYENDYWTPFRVEGQDDTGMPPRTLSPWCPPEGALEAAKKASFTEGEHDQIGTITYTFKFN